jgi:putative acyl-CoA dehydrogenase
MTPVAKYWLCKRNPALAVEAMECLGGNGYVEEAPLARLYREAPVNGIWEGSGNVICLDVLRSIKREPDSVDALLAEIASAGARFKLLVDGIARDLKNAESVERRARRVVEMLAIALQASLMVRHSTGEAAEAFLASRLDGDWGRSFGTLPATSDCAGILKRAMLS